MTEERWESIPGYVGKYQASTTGRIRRIYKKGYRILKQGKNTYLQVSLSRRGTVKTRTVHQLILETFIGFKQKGYVANHKDGNKWNNNLSNLEWCTYTQNNQHAMETGLWHPAQNHSSSRPVEQYDLRGNFLKRFKSCIEAERQTGISNGNICHVLNGLRETAGGYRWKKAG